MCGLVVLWGIDQAHLAQVKPGQLSCQEQRDIETRKQARPVFELPIPPPPPLVDPTVPPPTTSTLPYVVGSKLRPSCAPPPARPSIAPHIIGDPNESWSVPTDLPSTSRPTGPEVEW